MRIENDVIGPDALKVLQQIFDLIWNQLAQERRVDPGDHALKDHVSLMVINAAKNDVLDMEGVREHVLASLKSQWQHH